MNIIVTLVFMAIVGALIGGVTNHLAIKMLFWPYEAKYIGKWRVPLTPGLIPKRRDELSRQLGRTVVEHLLTPETFKKRFFNEEMHIKTEKWINRQLQKHLFNSPKSFNDWLQEAGQTEMDIKIEAKLDELVDLQKESLQQYIAGKTIRELMPENWKAETEAKLYEGVEYAISQGTTYFESPQGRQTIKSLLDEFLESRGRFGHMLHSLLGESKPLVDRIQPEIIKFLNSPRTFELVGTLAFSEWEKVQDRRVDELLKEFDFDTALTAVKQYVREKAAISTRLNTTLAETWPGGLKWTSVNFTPLVTDFVFEQGEHKLEETILKIDMEGMVKEQVDSLPLSRLEELVLGISRREFKMITVLGAFLGGFIGIFQGIFVMILN
ncbi:MULTISPECIES: DUF445 family protein [Planococcus]|uniref:DUF445 domain-containing protein n=2 Tax=Planococcus TaxID=1372 RepID=A0ABN4K0Y3_9BACL|nr:MULTISPECIES: DUF445 family protein [Planococcus]ALS79308.1 hypothetical protein AUO94_11920 [Planococcus kocurii]MDJ0332415.1 DUF445 family protein [Planococcus sp. S3-L1]